ncbi:MAG: tandem-95 repeat protein, partial [Planctomycetales bacterium]|nr:tandem-95 repeat protein [Planctomycetales bacterium]
MQRLFRRSRTRANRFRKNTRSFEALDARHLLAADINGTFYEDVDSSGTKTGPDNTLAGWTAYVDLDHNGVLDAGEPAAVANSGGDYVINMTGQASGVYQVTEIVQAGWTPTTASFREVNFTAGQSTSKIDFFNFAGGTIEGTVWHDLNDDGIHDATDPGLVGWTVFLDLDQLGTLDPGEPFVTTDASGYYAFHDVPAGDYEVTEILPTGWDVAKTYDIKQTATAEALTTVVQDFGNISTSYGSVSGTVWNDVDGNGDRATDPVTGLPTEPGLEGWTIFVDNNGNGTLDAGEPSTTTNAAGDYVFPSVLQGNHTIREVLPPNWSPAPGFAAVQTINVRAQENNGGVDFANFTVQNGAIQGTIWNDVNRDGIRNSLLGAFTEPGLPDWTVYLDLNRNGAFDSSEPSAVTDAEGVYVFPDLQIGEYDVIEIVPSGWETAPGFGDNQTVRVYSGATSTASDFANFNLSTLVPASVSGTVWHDRNGNGLQDTTPVAEVGSAGWTVFADVNGNRVADAGEPQAISGTDGTYTLTGIAPGSATLVIQSQSGWNHTAPISGVRALTLKNGDAVTGINFGEYQIQDSTISGTVYFDANHNQIRDVGERGLPGITVYLDLNNNQTRDADEPFAVSAEDQFFTPAVNEAGTYSFTHLASGTYAVRQEVPAQLSATPAGELEHVVTVVGSQTLANVDFADVYRANEIHGVKFDDINENGVQDMDEPGIAGTTVFIDLDRDDLLDIDEPQTTTLSDGSYEFLDLSPGAYVVREVLESGHSRTTPTTVGGILWPTGVSNAAVGNVDPNSITTSLAEGESYRRNVSITLPNSGGLTNMVDVFLLFDDTGSFVNNSPIVRGAFPTIMSQLQASLPGIDLGFGVGRFEEYGNFAAEYSTGRPFVLNQPIVAASTAGYQTAIQAALDRTTPGYGGDQPETDIEALYQLVTGLGFDGNNNGTVSDSGAAGLRSTQLTPGASGDVPSFASYTADASAGELPADGNIGGGGFRPGALPVVLLATDTGFAYQPKGETSVTGIGGLSLPLSQLTQTSRSTTPFSSGAGLQETITALNALGALVIGLGTNAGSTIDPRQGLEAIANLTGATNQSTTTIANGTADPIAPGDPFYFQIASGFASSVAAGVTNAIQNAVTNVAMNITVQASDPRVRIINHTGTINGVGAGETATFDIEIIGDGVPHRFDLQFVREGTNVVLGSIPVVLGTPIPGDGYHFDDLDEGEIEWEDHFGDVVSTTAPANVAPSFTAGGSQSVPEDAGLQTVAAWATNISAGPISEASQVLDFIVTNNNTSLFSVQPAISPDGTLTFTLAPDAAGFAVVSVQLHDDGGTANGGVDTSDVKTFVISITPVNDAPVAVDDSFTIDEDSPLSVATAGLLGNDFDVDSSPLTASLQVGPNHGTLTLNADGSFNYAPAPNYFGTDSFTYVANDGTLNSNVATVNITINAVNDAPVANVDNYVTDEDTPFTLTLSELLVNDTDIDGDALTARLISLPAHGTLSENIDGSLTYTPDEN